MIQWCPDDPVWYWRFSSANREHLKGLCSTSQELQGSGYWQQNPQIYCMCEFISTCMSYLSSLLHMLFFNDLWMFRLWTDYHNKFRICYLFSVEIKLSSEFFGSSFTKNIFKEHLNIGYSKKKVFILNFPYFVTIKLYTSNYFTGISGKNQHNAVQNFS